MLAVFVRPVQQPFPDGAHIRGKGFNEIAHTAVGKVHTYIYVTGSRAFIIGFSCNFFSVNVISVALRQGVGYM